MCIQPKPDSDPPWGMRWDFPGVLQEPFTQEDVIENRDRYREVLEDPNATFIDLLRKAEHLTPEFERFLGQLDPQAIVRPLTDALRWIIENGLGVLFSWQAATGDLALSLPNAWVGDVVPIAFVGTVPSEYVHDEPMTRD